MYSSSSKGPGPFVFVIAFSDPRAIEPAAPAGKGTHSIVVQIEPEDVFFTLSVMDPERATRTFARRLHNRRRFWLLKKSFPTVSNHPSLLSKSITFRPSLKLDSRTFV